MSPGEGGHLSRCLLLFSKPARPGQVKTRLIGELSPEQAAQLHGAFLADLAGRLSHGRFTLQVAWALAAEEPIPDQPPGGSRQVGEDLGQRLYQALGRAAQTFPLVAAVGSDHPELPLSIVHQAFDKLVDGSDLVLGPAEDGGYYLVGARRQALQPQIFDDVPWSTAAVLETTLERCRSLELKVDLLPTGADVDTPDDLSRLIVRLAQRPELDCPSTRRLLETWGRLKRPSGGAQHENP